MDVLRSFFQSVRYLILISVVLIKYVFCYFFTVIQFTPFLGYYTCGGGERETTAIFHIYCEQ